MADQDTVTVERTAKTSGVAGQFSVKVWVKYDGEPTTVVEFVGNAFGGPVVMVSGWSDAQTFVTDPERFGPFTPKTCEVWARRFFGEPVEDVGAQARMLIVMSE